MPALRGVHLDLLPTCREALLVAACLPGRRERELLRHVLDDLVLVAVLDLAEAASEEAGEERLLHVLHEVLEVPLRVEAVPLRVLAVRLGRALAGLDDVEPPVDGGRRARVRAGLAERVGRAERQVRVPLVEAGPPARQRPAVQPPRLGVLEVLLVHRHEHRRAALREHHLRPHARVVAIARPAGDRVLDVVGDDGWLALPDGDGLDVVRLQLAVALHEHLHVVAHGGLRDHASAVLVAEALEGRRRRAELVAGARLVVPVPELLQR